MSFLNMCKICLVGPMCREECEMREKQKKRNYYAIQSIPITFMILAFLRLSYIVLIAIPRGYEPWF